MSLQLRSQLNILYSFTLQTQKYTKDIKVIAKLSKSVFYSFCWSSALFKLYVETVIQQRLLSFDLKLFWQKLPFMLYQIL